MEKIERSTALGELASIHKGTAAAQSKILSALKDELE